MASQPPKPTDPMQTPVDDPIPSPIDPTPSNPSDPVEPDGRGKPRLTVVPDTECYREAVIEPWTHVIFSLEDGFVWAGWPGTFGSVKLGKYGPVKAMMQDFLDQSALGERLAYRQGKR